LTLTFDPAIRHIILQQSSTSTYVPTFIQIEETFSGRTDVRTYGRTFFPSILDLIMDLYSAFRSKDTEALDAAQEN